MRYAAAARDVVHSLAIAAASGLMVGFFAPIAHAAPSPAHAVSSQYIDPLGRPTPHAQRIVRDVANQPGVPPHVRDALLNGLSFAAGTGELGGPPLPADGPEFRKALWPTVSVNCMGPGSHSTGSLIAVAGPANTPAPAPTSGQVTFVFTALGTPAAAPRQGNLHMYWVNLDNARHGVTQLGNHGINPTGPATLSGVADTGSGPVLAVLAGAVHTTSATCGFAPTALHVTVK